MNSKTSREQARPYRTVVFAGTTEGYATARFLSSHGVSVDACTATEYGADCLEENAFLKVFSGRLEAAGMAEFLLRQHPDLVVDATHPYAALATENIRTACRETGTDYIRIQRSSSEESTVMHNFTKK